MIKPNRIHAIEGHGEVPLSVPEYGQPGGKPIVLLHGFSQCHLSWARQVASGPLTQRYRLIVPDTRGHGMSGKPAPSPEVYTRSEPYAHDIAAILTELDLDRPVIAGWSMGGIWANDFLRVFGDDAISGVALIGSFSATGKYSPPDALAAREADPAVKAPGMMSPDLAENLAATEEFLAACFATVPEPADFAWMLAFNMMCPPDVRAAVRPRQEDYRPGLSGLSVPALVLHGRRDRIVPFAYAEQSVDAIPGAELVVYEDSGHAPFWEEADRFNDDLARFAARCFEEAA